MLFKSTLIATLIASASAALTSDSKAGAKLLSKARNLNQNADQDFSWMAKYSIKFEGCHSIHAYNNEAQEAEGQSAFGVTHLAKFKLCPSSSNCNSCSGGGVYMTNLMEFGEAYLEAEREIKESKCQAVEENCDCQYYYGDDQACLAKCYKDAGLDYCGQEEAEFDPAEYLECKEADFQDNYGNPYYIGPVCSHQGSSVRLALFTDMSCTTQAASGIYEANNYYGNSLPYSSKDMLSTTCLSCKDEQNAQANDDANAYYQAPEPLEVCTELYEQSSKCEKNMSSKQYKDTGSCEYIHKIVPALETVYHKSGTGGGAAKGFAVFFALTTVAAVAAAAFYYNKVQRTTVDLSSSAGAIA